MQVLRVYRFSTFALPPALPPCCCPLAFQRQVRRLTSRISSESYPGYPECIVSCHGADRFANSIRRLDEKPIEDLLWTCNRRKRLSFCHLNKQCLINTLEAE